MCLSGATWLPVNCCFSELTIKHVCLVQSRHHHLIQCNLFLSWYSCKIAHLALNNNHSLYVIFTCYLFCIFPAEVFTESEEESIQNRCSRTLANLALTHENISFILKTDAVEKLAMLLQSSKTKENLLTYSRTARYSERRKRRGDVTW